MKEFIKIGKLNRKMLNKLGIDIVTDDVIFTFERIEHVKSKRILLYDEVKNILPIAIYSPDYIYKDWNNRDNTYIFIKDLYKNTKMNIAIKMSEENDNKHPKNSIITVIKIGEKTFNKIYRNKMEKILFQKLDKIE